MATYACLWYSSQQKGAHFVCIQSHTSNNAFQLSKIRNLENAPIFAYHVFPGNSSEILGSTFVKIVFDTSADDEL